MPDGRQTLSRFGRKYAARLIRRDHGARYGTNFRTGFTAILLQFSFANWIINYPIVSPFAANWHIGELWGGRRGPGGSKGGSKGGRNRFSFAIMYHTVYTCNPW